MSAGRSETVGVGAVGVGLGEGDVGEGDVGADVPGSSGLPLSSVLPVHATADRRRATAASRVGFMPPCSQMHPVPEPVTLLSSPWRNGPR
jgi:hypothetical protein